MEETESIVREETPNSVTKRAKKFLHEDFGCSHGVKGGPCSREFREYSQLSPCGHLAITDTP